MTTAKADKVMEGISDADLKLFAACFIYAKADTSVNFDAVAQELDSASARSIQERLRVAKKKLSIDPSAVPAGAVTKKTPSKTTPSKPRKAAGDKAGGGAKTPSKRGKAAVKAVDADPVTPPEAETDEGYGVGDEV